MQGFINTTAGLRPLLIEGIESVSYQLYSTPTANHGILSIKYIANQGIGGGNIYVYIPYYVDNTQYPIEQFWKWVSDIANGAIGKTYNSYLNNQPFPAIQYATNSSSYSQSFAYVAKLADDATLNDACNYAFETADISGTVNTFTNVVTSNAANSTPNVGDRIYIASNQGYDPNPFEKGNEAAYTPSPDNPALLDGIYSYLNGNPAYIEAAGGKGTTIPQEGNVFRVQIQGGIIVVAEACPVDFTQLGGVDDIDAFLYIHNNGFPGFQTGDVCFDTAPNPPTTITNSGQWIQVKLGFLLFPNSAPQLEIQMGAPQPYFVCNYIDVGGGVMGSVTAGMKLPQNAEVYLKDDVTGAYKKFANGNSWQLNNVNEKGPITYQYSSFYDGIIAVPPEAYFGISANEYAFKVDWGADYPDDLGFDLECEYFKRQSQGAPEPGQPAQYITAAGNPEGTGVLNSPWWPCMQAMA